MGGTGTSTPSIPARGWSVGASDAAAPATDPWQAQRWPLASARTMHHRGTTLDQLSVIVVIKSPASDLPNPLK